MKKHKPAPVDEASPLLSEAGANQVIENVISFLRELGNGQHEHRGPVTYLLTNGLDWRDAEVLGVPRAYFNKAKQRYGNGEVSDSALLQDKAKGAKRTRGGE
jgi:hypothetical protein